VRATVVLRPSGLIVPCRYISNVPHSRGWERKIAEGPPCVVLASPGFATNGPSRELLELWAPDSRNGIILTGYSIEGTMARVSGYTVSWGTSSHGVLYGVLALYVPQHKTMYYFLPSVAVPVAAVDFHPERYLSYFA
jgi:Cft2 family RNA processing exonuclease